MSDATVTAGRGVLYIAVAKLYFMVAGYAIYFTLPRLLGSEVLWGNYLLVVGLVSVIDNVIVTGTIQGVSRFTAQDDSLAEGVKRSALLVQLVIGGGIAAIYVLGAPLIARWERDASLTGLYRISCGIMICYAFYAVFVGSLNGLQRFGRQASLDMGFATIRMALILGFAAAGWGVAGAIGGFVCAAATILLLSAWWVGLPRGPLRYPVGPIWRFLIKLYVYTLALNLIMRVDLFLLKRLVGTLTGEADGAARAALASAYAGYYGTAQSLAFIPYQAILAVAFVVFPLVSRSTFISDLQATRSYIRQTLRFSFIFVCGVAVVFLANPEAVIAVPYPDRYRVGGPALGVLAGGMVCFSMFTIINTILNGAGRAGQAIVSGGITLAAAVTANALLIPRASSAEDALLVAACATSAAMGLGLLLSAGLLFWGFRASFPPLSVIRVLLCSAVVMGLGHVVPEVSRLVTMIESTLLFLVYLGLLALLREFSAEDLARFVKIISRQGSARGE